MAIYVKLDANYEDDPAILEAGEKAELLFIRGLALAKRTLSDGFIADVQLPKFGLSSVKTRAERLCSVGLWVRDDDQSGYWIAGWSKWNRSKTEVEEIRNKRAEAGSKGGKASGQARREAKPKQSASANGKQPPNPESEVETETEPKPLAPDKPTRKRDPIFEALIEACGWDLSALTDSARGRTNKAAKELRKIGATPEGIHARAGVHRQKWPDMSLTPNSLSANYAELGKSNVQQQTTVHNDICPDCEQVMSRHNDETCEAVQAVMARG